MTGEPRPSVEGPQILPPLISEWEFLTGVPGSSSRGTPYTPVSALTGSHTQRGMTPCGEFAMPPRPSTVAGNYHYDDYGRSRPAARTRLSLLPNLDKKEVFAQFKPKKPKSNYGEAPAKRPPKGRYGRSPNCNRDNQVYPRGSPSHLAYRVNKESVDKDADLVHAIVTQEEFTKGCFHLKDFAPGALPAVPSQNLQGGMGSLSRVGSAAPEKQESFADVDEETPRGLHLLLPPSGPGDDAQYEERLLADIPARVACEKYKTVSVSGWHLMEKDPVFESPEQLVRVPLTNEQAANAGVHETPSELGQRLVKRLTYDVQKKQRPHTPKRHLPGVPKLSKAVGSGETVLNLSDSKMGPRQVCALAFTLPQQTAISTLILSKNTIDDGCCELLVAALRIEPNISQLDLSHNKIGFKGAALLSALFKKIPEGKTRFTPVITNLNVRGNPLGNSGVSRLITEFRSTTCTLRNLDIAECAFTEKGAHHLGEMLLVNRSLTTLNLSWNKVGIKGAQSLATALTSHPRLMSLNMAHVGMSDAGTGYIASALAENFTIQHLDISNNTIRGGACAVLASSLMARGHIDFLDLSNNPLGQMGAARLLKTFTAGFVKKVGLQGCNFVDLSQSNSGVVNERNPNGSYALDLSNPLQYQQAADLATLWKDHGPQSWQESKLDGKPFKLTDALKWPDHMPRVGQLRLRFQSANARPVKITPLSEEEFTNMWSSAIGASATDEWKVTFAMLLSSTVYLTAEQVAKMLSTFTWPSERLEAAMTLFGRITDPHNQHHIDAQLTSETRAKYEKELGPLRQFHPYNPTGHYNLNLTRKVDYCIATQLLAYYAQEESDGICSKERLQKSWRNVVLNGRFIESIDPHSWEIPTEGSLKLDYVSYNLPDTKKSNTKFNTLSDLRLLALEAVLCLNRQPEPLKIEAFTKAYFHQHFMELWNLNFNRRSSLENRIQAMKEAKEMMKGSKSNRFKRRATQVANVMGMLSNRSNLSSRDGSEGDLNESIPKGFTVGLPPGAGATTTNPKGRRNSVIDSGVSTAKKGSKTDTKPSKVVTATSARAQHGERSGSISGSPRPQPPVEEPETWDPTSTGIKNFHTALNCLRVLSVNQYISVKHLSRLLEFFAVSDEHVIEVVVIFWQRILDRARFPELMKKISKKAQAGIGQRLGPLNIFNANMPDHHWLLRLSQRDEHEVLKRLVRIAVKDTTCNSVNNLYINGRQMPRITEDESLYTVLSGHVQDGMIPTNVLEFDFELSKLTLQNAAAKLIQARFKALKKRQMAKGTWGKKKKK